MSDEEFSKNGEAPEKGGRELPGPEAWLRPMDELRVGDRFASRGRTVTEADVVNFAGVTGDFHPAHTDATWAEEHMFGARVAHGMLAVCFAIGLVPNDYIMALRRIRTIVFKKPLFFGDTIHVEGRADRIVELSDEVGLVTGRWKIVNQRDETIVVLDIDALWRRTKLNTRGRPALETGSA
jgi:acyl dehydratase